MVSEQENDDEIAEIEELFDLEQASVLQLGSEFAGRYLVEEQLGIGGMGCVYRVKDNRTGDTLALKVLQNSMLSDVAARRRFVREGRASLMLKHPHIVQVHEFSVAPDGLPYMTMEYLQGESLADILLKSGPLTLPRFITSFAQILSALSHAHELGIIHRDIKPSNIMFVPTNRGRENIKLVDFGVAKLISDSGGTQELTVLGEFIGSPCYMSPEQCEGNDVDNRADLYALGCVMYEALTGIRAFRAGNSLRIMHMQVHEMPQPFHKVVPDMQVPKWLDQLIFKTLAKNPNDRYENAHKLKIDLLDGRFRSQDEGTATHFSVLPWESLRGMPFDETSSGSFEVIPREKPPPPFAAKTSPAATLAVGTVSNPQVFKSFNWNVLKLLSNAGILNEEDLRNARQFQQLNGGDLGRILILLGRIDHNTLIAAKTAQHLIQLGELKQDKAVSLVRLCRKNGQSLEDAINFSASDK